MRIEQMQFPYSKDITAVNQEQFDANIKLYEGYVKKINEIDEILQGDSQADQANSIYSFFRGVKRGESFAIDGVILHELYFENLGNRFAGPDNIVKQKLAQDFKSFENWQADFVATGLASRGWAVLAYDQRSRCFRNVSMDAHDEGNVVLCFPILVMDVYEHAYFYQYKTDKAAYINAFMNNINWLVVNRRMLRL